MSQNYEENIITNNKNYDLSKNIIFIRKKENNDLDESLYQINYNELTEELQDKLDEKFSCSICNSSIKNENPYFCYECQKIFHVQCLKNWDEKRKQLKENLNCMCCRKELPLEQWKQKIDYEENRKNEAESMSKINELTKENNIKDILIKIYDEKMNELKDALKKKQNLLKRYRHFIDTIFSIIEWISKQMILINSNNKPFRNETLQIVINYYGDKRKIQCPKYFYQFIFRLCDILQISTKQINKFKIYNIINDKKIVIKN